MAREERRKMMPGSEQIELVARLLARLCCVAWLVASCLAAYAKPEYPPIVIAAYQLKSGGTVAGAANSCNLCHVAAGPPALNPYGRDVRSALDAAHTKTLTAAVLHSIDSKDSDGDGYPNSQELASDTLPGDPKSHPAGKPEAPAAVSATGSAQTSAAATEPGLFSWQRLVVPKSAQHPALIHFPIGVFVVSVIFDVLGWIRRKPGFYTAAYYNLIAAAISGIVAVGTGLAAWQFAFGGAALQGTLLYHLVTGCLSTALFWTLWFMRRRRGQDAQPSTLYMALAFVALLLVALTGHLGGGLAGTA